MGYASAADQCADVFTHGWAQELAFGMAVGSCHGFLFFTAGCGAVRTKIFFSCQLAEQTDIRHEQSYATWKV